jgi:hypothetical protein
VTTEELAKESDFVFVLAPGGPSSYHLVDREFLGLMKRTAVLVNPGRGGSFWTICLILTRFLTVHLLLVIRIGSRLGCAHRGIAGGTDMGGRTRRDRRWYVQGDFENPQQSLTGLTSRTKRHSRASPR